MSAEQKAREILSEIYMVAGSVFSTTDRDDIEKRIAAALLEAETAAYEQGYAEGGGGTWADFYLAVSEFTDAEQGENDRPIDVIRKVEAAAYERAAQVAETIPYVEYKGDWRTLTGAEWTRFTSDAIATAIRQLKDKGE